MVRHDPDLRLRTAGDDLEHDALTRLQRVERAHDGSTLAELEQDVSTREHLEHACLQTLAGSGRRTGGRVVAQNPELGFWTAGDDLENDTLARLQQVAGAHDGSVMADLEKDVSAREHLEHGCCETLPDGLRRIRRGVLRDDSKLRFVPPVTTSTTTRSPSCSKVLVRTTARL